MTERQLWRAHDRPEYYPQARYLAQAMEALLRHSKVESEDPRDLEERAALRNVIKSLIATVEDA